ncbi:hypothetical protein IWQ61_008240 [Dispira simplex]|nr:hypothetical protein IWQ61_008240 [Dispira simplex]
MDAMPIQQFLGEIDKVNALQNVLKHLRALLNYAETLYLETSSYANHNPFYIMDRREYFAKYILYYQYRKDLEEMYKKHLKLVSYISVHFPEYRKIITKAVKTETGNRDLNNLKNLIAKWKRLLELTQKANDGQENVDLTWVDYDYFSPNEVFLLFPMLYSTNFVSEKDHPHVVGKFATAIRDIQILHIKVSQEQIIPMFILWYVSKYGFSQGKQFVVDFSNSMSNPRMNNGEPEYYCKRQYLLHLDSTEATTQNKICTNVKNPDVKPADPADTMVNYYGQLYLLTVNSYAGGFESQLRIPKGYYQNFDA